MTCSHGGSLSQFVSGADKRVISGDVTGRQTVNKPAAAHTSGGMQRHKSKDEEFGHAKARAVEFRRGRMAGITKQGKAHTDLFTEPHHER